MDNKKNRPPNLSQKAEKERNTSHHPYNWCKKLIYKKKQHNYKDITLKK